MRTTLTATTLLASCALANPYADLLGQADATAYNEAWIAWECDKDCPQTEDVEYCEEIWWRDLGERADSYVYGACIDAEVAATCIDLMNEYPRSENCLNTLPECHPWEVVVPCE